jgi:hypothetical protein
MDESPGLLNTTTGAWQSFTMDLNGTFTGPTGSGTTEDFDIGSAYQGITRTLSYYPFLSSQFDGPFNFIGGMHDGYGSIPDQYDDKCQLLRHEWHPGQHWDKFIPTWFHEIGLKDVNTIIPGTLKDHVLALYGGQTFDFPIVLDIPHPFHYKPASSVASLNFVNDLEILLYFNDYRMWIQNYKDVAEFAEFKVDKFSLITQYYNVPRGVWRLDLYADLEAKPLAARTFLVEDLFQPDAATLTYSQIDRIIVGGIMPVGKAVTFAPELGKHTSTDNKADAKSAHAAD